MRAREPDADGFVDRDGVKLHWEGFGDGEPTLLLLPTWTIVHARFWKAQVPYLARHFRVVTYDGPGNGRSDRPLDPGPYGYEAEARAAAAVLDATGTDRAVVVSLSMGAQWALWLMANRPERLLGSVFIGPAVDLELRDGDVEDTFDEPYTSTEGWAKYNRYYWLDHYQDFLEFFFAQCFSEAHSTKQVEDAVGWGLETSPEVLIAEHAGPEPDEATARDWCARSTCPVLVIHGDEDQVVAPRHGRALAEATGGTLVVLGGRRPHPQRPRPGQGEPAHPRVRPVAAGAGAAMTTVQARQAGRAAAEQTRARYPDDEGHVERDGVRVFWERYGDGEPTVFLLPTWSIVHSRFWKAQIPYLARHFRVLTFDGRGNGRSDRPAGAAAYTEREFAADALAVLDATATERAVLVSLSCGALWSTLLAADHPDRVDGIVYIGPAVGLAPPHPERAVHSFFEPLDTDEGWARYNQHYWLRDYRGFLEYFFSRCLTEPHSTKQHEDCVAWALEMAPETLIDTEEGLLLCGLESFERQCRRLRCPVLVVHGDEDAIRPHAQGAALAAATGGRLVTLAGAGHLPQARDPVKVNLLIREFVESLGGRAR